MSADAASTSACATSAGESACPTRTGISNSAEGTSCGLIDVDAVFGASYAVEVPGQRSQGVGDIRTGEGLSVAGGNGSGTECREALHGVAGRLPVGGVIGRGPMQFRALGGDCQERLLFCGYE